MKKISAIIIALSMLFTFTACGGSMDGADKADKPSGKTETVEVLVGFYIDGVIDRAYDYDSNGNMILDITYKSDGVEEYERRTWLYDEDNKLLKETSTGVITEYKLKSTEYSYDEKGHLYLETLSNGNRYEYINDENGNCVERKGINADGSSGSRAVYEYDSEGRCILESFYLNDGTFDYKRAYEYDGNDRVTTEIRTDADGFEDKFIYTYDADGERLTTENFENGVRVRDYGYELDENGNRIKYYYYTYGESTVDPEETLYTLDDAGNITRADKCEHGEMEEYTLYEYDSNGRKSACSRYDDDGDFIYSETITYTDSGLRLKRNINHPHRSETVDYVYKLIEVPSERAQWVRDFQMEYDP